MSDFKTFGSYLICPHCSTEYLHLREVHVMARDGESNEYGLCIDLNVEQSTFKCGTYIDENTSKRDATTLTFWCELCGKDSQLTFAQEKGMTAIK